MNIPVAVRALEKGLTRLSVMIEGTTNEGMARSNVPRKTDRARQSGNNSTPKSGCHGTMLTLFPPPVFGADQISLPHTDLHTLWISNAKTILSRSHPSPGMSHRPSRRSSLFFPVFSGLFLGLFRVPIHGLMRERPERVQGGGR